jgi:CheY-like chemotaxis protein
MRMVMAASLRSAGFEVFEAATGAELVRLYDRHRQQSRDVVIVTDVDMPVMNGLRAVEQIRARRMRVSIILVSGLTNAATLESVAERVGADAVFAKPFDVFALRETAERLLGRMRRAVSSA